MGFSFRKSINLGIGKINLSKSGVSVSAGVKGAKLVHRLTGKRKGTNTIYASKSIFGFLFRYIKSFGGKNSKSINRKSE